MTKHDKSRWGTWVIATPEAVRLNIAKAGTKGIILDQDGKLIRVLKENIVTSYWYFEGFWEEIDAN